MMKSLAVLAVVATGANAFAPLSATSNTKTVLKASELDGKFGVTTETGNKVFDPLGLNEWVPFEWARKAELANGRSAMLATVGWVWPAIFGTFDSNDVTTTNPIEAFGQADAQWWAQFIIFCGTIEGYKYKQEMDGKSYTGEGDAAIDWTGAWSKLSDEKKEEMRMKELKNGRLAMIGIAGFAAAYFIPGSVPFVPDV